MKSVIFSILDAHKTKHGRSDDCDEDCGQNEHSIRNESNLYKETIRSVQGGIIFYSIPAFEIDNGTVGLFLLGTFSFEGAIKLR